MLPRKSICASREACESFGSKSANTFELRVVGVGDVHVVLVVPAPEEGLAAGDALDVVGGDAAAAQHRELLVAEVVADGADDADLGEEARREREVDGGAAEHALALPERRAHGVERDRADDGQGHGCGRLAGTIAVRLRR